MIHSPTPAGSELLNNYGPKPNSELILGYGFSIPQNPDDTIVLSIGGVQDTAKQKWEVGRGANGVDGLWAQVLDAVSQTPTSEKDSEESPAKRFEDQLDAAGMLGQMCQAYLDRLPDPANTRNIRPNVQGMLEHYVEGASPLFFGGWYLIRCEQVNEISSRQSSDSLRKKRKKQLSKLQRWALI